MPFRFDAITVIVLSVTLSRGAQAQIPSWVDYPHEARAEFVQSFASLGRIDAAAGTLLYPAGSEVINKSRSDLPESHPLYGDPGDFFESGEIVLARIPAEAIGSESDCYVVYTELPSFDPGFYLVPEGSNEQSMKMSGEVLAIGDDGHLHTLRRINSHFPRKGIWTLQGGEVREIRQPFYWVGLRSETLVPVTLYGGPVDDGVVGNLEAGVPVEVVLTDDVGRGRNVFSYLVRTQSGVMGWVQAPSSYATATVLAGIFWLGD